MSLRVLAASAGLLGGLCWVSRWVAELADGADPGWGEQAYLAGLVLLGLGLAGAGAGLVSSSAGWLRLIVAVALPVLVGSVWSVVRGESGSTALGVIGVLATLAGGGGPGEGTPRRRGGPEWPSWEPRPLTGETRRGMICPGLGLSP